MTNFHYPSPLGTLVITIMNDQISSVAFNGKSFVLEPSLRGDKFDEAISSKNAISTTEHFSTSRRVRVKERTSLTNKIQKQLDDYFAGKLRVFDLPLLYQGTPFQMKVWMYLQTIPYGKTMSYQDVAQAIGHPRSARAVGTACKRNPIPLIIPCHRVVRSDGKTGEYAGGKTRKIRLLYHESSHV